ncbi:Fc.00g055090.m01.CDS01 [Cosmosporella sp. VM-42]
MAEPVEILTVPHLGGIDVGYRLSSTTLDKSKPTLVLYNPFTTTADYYLPEFKNKALCETLNLLAIEPLGHGRTHLKKTESFTYWDSAIASLQLLDALGIGQVFAMGTSQGGWIACRLALLAPERVNGIIPVGCSMDSESLRSRELGCWDGPTACSGLVTLAGNLAPAPDFEPGEPYYDFLMDIGFGKSIDKATKDFWTREIRDNYCGDQGKRRICMAAVALAGRDGLHERLPYIKCPVLWFQGNADVVFSLAQAQEDIKLFTNSVEAQVVPCEGGVHFLSWTHAEKLHKELLEFIHAWNKRDLALL